jgi:phosphate butyryltransferase
MSREDGDIYNMKSILDSAKTLPACRMAAVMPYDEASLKSIACAHSGGIVHPLLVGDESRIKSAAEQYKIDINDMEIVHARDEAIETASHHLLEGRADFIMKGMVGTGNFFHTILEPRFQIRTERILSHVGIFELPVTERIFLMSDAAINILPNFTRKIHIVANAVDAARRLGILDIKVAMLAAVEKLNLPAMPATLDAFLMKKYTTTGYFGRCEVDGPFAFDNALDPEKARTKEIGGKVAGNANIIICPNIETGNVIWKTITCIHKGEAAGVVLGARCPIVLPSRSDDYKTKLNSIQFARILL